MRIKLILFLFLVTILSCNGKNSSEKIKLTLNVEKIELTAKNNELIRDYRPDKIGFKTKLIITNVSNGVFNFDMWTCSFHQFLTTNTLNAKIFGPVRCDQNVISEIKLKPNEKIEYDFMILKDNDKNLTNTEDLENVKIGLTEIHTDWNLEKSVIDQADEQFKANNKKIYWSNSVDIK